MHQIDLTDEELRIVQAALHAYLQDFGHEEADLLRAIKKVIAKFPEVPPAAAHSGPPVLWPIELAGGAALAVPAAIALARPDDVGTYAAEHTTGVAMLAVIAALGLALAGGVARTLRR